MGLETAVDRANVIYKSKIKSLSSYLAAALAGVSIFGSSLSAVKPAHSAPRAEITEHLVQQASNPSITQLEQTLNDPTKEIRIVPHIAYGGPELSWNTNFTFKNNGKESVPVYSWFFNASGSALSLDLMKGSIHSSLEVLLQGSGVYTDTTRMNLSSTQTGYAVVAFPKGSDVDISVGFAGFSVKENKFVYQIETPASKSSNSFSSFFYRHPGSVETGVAVANPNPFPINLYINLKDRNGKLYSVIPLALEAGQQKSMMSNEMFQGETNPDMYNGSINISGNHKFSALTLGFTGSTMFLLPNSDKAVPVKELAGYLKDLNGGPIPSQEVTLTDGNYKDSAGNNVPATYTASTDRNGYFKIGILGDFGGNLEMDIKSDLFYNHNKIPITLDTLVKDLGTIKLTPRFVNEKGEDALEFTKYMVVADGTGVNGNTMYLGWDTWPVPVFYKPAGTPQAFQIYRAILNKGNQMIDIAAEAPTLKEASELPTVDKNGQPYLDDSGRPIGYGIIVEFREGIGARIDYITRDAQNKLRQVKILMPYTNDPAFAGLGLLSSYLHEVIAHALPGAGRHSRNLDDVSADGEGNGIPTQKEAFMLKYLRHWNSPRDLRRESR